MGVEDEEKSIVVEAAEGLHCGGSRVTRGRADDGHRSARARKGGPSLNSWPISCIAKIS